MGGKILAEASIFLEVRLLMLRRSLKAQAETKGRRLAQVSLQTASIHKCCSWRNGIKNIVSASALQLASRRGGPERGLTRTTSQQLAKVAARMSTCR